MKLPYQCLQLCGDVLFAAQGGSLHTFRAADGAHISTWKHPVAEEEADARRQAPGPRTAARAAGSPAGSPGPEAAEQGPPAKRPRLVGLDEPAEKSQEGARTAPALAQRDGEDAGEDRQEGGKGKKQQHRQKGPIARPPERAFISVLTATADGRHVVAVTGQDKTVWVFEHDGAGHVKQLSQRPMPKRPCSAVITPDGKTILSADKFGDVYALPVLAGDPLPAPDARARQASAPAPPQPFRPQANPLTVHTKGNLRALEAQQRQLQRRAQAAAAPAPGQDAPAAEHALLLGHVSLLTCVALGRHGGREYILTADRDEHIRVSRGAPQAHVVEAYCLGHGEFVSRLCVPGRLPELLVSGGGDADLFAWRWREGRLLARAPLLARVREVSPGATKVAVSGLHACWERGLGSAAGPTCTVLVICERVPAIFCYVLEADGTLRFARSVGVPGNPLAIESVRPPGPEPASRAILAVDAVTPAGRAGGPSLLTVAWGRDGVAQLGPLGGGGAEGGGEVDMTAEELASLLYANESLRKMDHERDGAAETEQ